MYSFGFYSAYILIQCYSVQDLLYITLVTNLQTLAAVQGDVYAVEPDNDGVWYHQVLDAHWGLGEEEDDVSLLVLQHSSFG